MVTRTEILQTAEELIKGDRHDDYGDALKNWEDIQRIIIAIEKANPSLIGTPIGHALRMIAVKIARICTSPDHIDSWVDICGYAALAAEMAEEQMKQEGFRFENLEQMTKM